jgi:hypothetical protein
MAQAWWAAVREANDAERARLGLPPLQYLRAPPWRAPQPPAHPGGFIEAVLLAIIADQLFDFDDEIFIFFGADAATIREQRAALQAANPGATRFGQLLSALIPNPLQAFRTFSRFLTRLAARPVFPPTRPRRPPAATASTETPQQIVARYGRQILAEGFEEFLSGFGAGDDGNRLLSALQQGAGGLLVAGFLPRLETRMNDPAFFEQGIEVIKEYVRQEFAEALDAAERGEAGGW